MTKLKSLRKANCSLNRLIIWSTVNQLVPSIFSVVEKIMEIIRTLL